LERLGETDAAKKAKADELAKKEAEEKKKKTEEEEKARKEAEEKKKSEEEAAAAAAKKAKEEEEKTKRDAEEKAEKEATEAKEKLGLPVGKAPQRKSLADRLQGLSLSSPQQETASSSKRIVYTKDELLRYVLLRCSMCGSSPPPSTFYLRSLFFTIL